MNEFVCSVTKENRTGYYRIHTIWENNGFKINIASQDASWMGEMNADNMKTMSTQLSLSGNEYMNECKDALTNNGGKPGLSYAVENGMFTWKKLIDEDTGDKMMMGTIRVQPTQFTQTIQAMMGVALDNNKQLTDEVAALKEEKKLSSTYTNELEKKLEDLIKVKISMEEDLYLKFISILNAKKAQIAELEDALSLDKQSGSKTNKPTANVKPTSKQQVLGRRNRKTVKEGGEYDVDTDNDPDSEEERELVKQARITRKGKAMVRKAVISKKTATSALPTFINEQNQVQLNVGEEPTCSRQGRNENILDSMGIKNHTGSTGETSINSSAVAEDSSITSCSVGKPDNSRSKEENRVGTPDKTDNDKHLPSTQYDLLNFFFGNADSPRLVDT